MGLHTSDLGSKPLFATGLTDVNATNLEGDLGQPRITSDGRKFLWVKSDASAAITKGQCLMQTALIAASTITTAATTTSLDVYTTNTVANLYGPGDFIYVTTGTGEGQMAEIDHSVDATHLKLLTPLTTALVTTSQVAIWRPWRVKATTADAAGGLGPVGVAQVAVATATPYFWMQVAGPGIVQLDSSETAPVINKPVVVSTALAGAACGITPGTTTTIGQINESTRIVGRAVLDNTNTADSCIPVLLTLGN